ncbi:tRNA (adenosine(37)-N6)-threonylcarbamoyltransferase complex dimerization subunit type 1 TsaB [Alteribacillus sp. YIM 98480]|uniref:tRNA (adenosine(37)-N6)-threonylcarbamoyltransferase complex dimerization subunit type 1 TsaB n=1 Tax=Alteribacillus sp. YIM 98480 TaxID=2606599 RepID=UPI00131AB2B9|nr:tRNA (adenosine(37)-N6)-threonylcarbamoyltransferase complex dimerization subunit type 1 TsaB [Alteribacillus sp. YIM 98480]
MKILAIDTSTHVMGAALAEDDKLLGEYITNFKKNHSLRLMPAIDHLMNELEIEPKELDAIAVAKGPGSYTGVRIGVTTAKSMAWALNIPVYGISSLQMLAQNGKYFSGYICPFMDARRGQVYTGLYTSENGCVKEVEKDRIIILEDWIDLLKEKQEPVLFLSQEWDKHKEAIQEKLSRQVVYGSFSDMLPKPSKLLEVVLNQGESISSHELVPEYTQLTEAEKNWLASNKGKRNDE